MEQVEQFFTEQLPNGVTLLGQYMGQVSSAALTISVRGGSSYDPPHLAGAAAIVGEWSLRGAGSRDTHALNDKLDSLGCQHHESVLSEHIQFAAVQLSRNLDDVLEVCADILRRPKFDDATFELSRSLIRKDLSSIEDEPAKKATMILRENFYPSPLGRCVYGTPETLSAMTAEEIRKHVRTTISPAETIICVAGKIDWDTFRVATEKHFGDWQGDGVSKAAIQPPKTNITHIVKDTAQVHIALAHKAVPIHDSGYYAARLTESILSGGMSSRLFTEVREKRGLVYHISSRYSSLKDHAGMFTYAGTVPQKAQETFDVTVSELKRMGEGIEPDELAIAKTQLKSSLVMHGESTCARAGALSSDWYHLKHLRSLQEISREIDKLTADDVLEYLHRFPAENFTVLVIGPRHLDTSSAEG